MIAVKIIVYAATLGASGAVFFLGYGGAWIANPERAKIRRIVLGLCELSVLAGILQIVASAGSMSGAASGMWDESLLRMVWQAGAGRVAIIRTLGLLLGAIGMSWDRTAWLGYLGAAAAATSFAWTGHARALDQGALPVLLQGIHLIGVAFWLGALPPLLIIARDGALPLTAAVAARFGAVAIWVVGVLIAAGSMLLWALLGGFAALWTSTYGRCVVLKLILVACLLGAAGFNKLRLTPRLLNGDHQAAETLRATIRLELLFGGLILAVTAVFTTIAGPPALD